MYGWLYRSTSIYQLLRLRQDYCACEGVWSLYYTTAEERRVGPSPANNGI